VEKAFKRWEEDASSTLSPTGQQFERLAWDLVDDWLLTYCGLRVVPAYKSRLSDTDAASAGRQWDGRFLTTVVDGWVPPAKDSFKFIVYGGGGYTQPPSIKERKLSPSKSPMAQYFAALEYTSNDKWHETWKSESGSVRKGLLERLEERLFTLMQRGGAAGQRVRKIDDLVALVGVAGTYPCDSDVERVLSDAKSAAKYPLLIAMFRAHRFVFFPFYAVAASPKVVAGAATGATVAGVGSHVPGT
jgi:hypothetical protein